MGGLQAGFGGLRVPVRYSGGGEVGSVGYDGVAVESQSEVSVAGVTAMPLEERCLSETGRKDAVL